MANFLSTLVLGGAASGKSAFAETLVLDQPGRPIYIATAEAFDAEMIDKIAVHKARRGAVWTNVEEPLDLAGIISRADAPDSVLLVDCLTIWLSNLMADDRIALSIPDPTNIWRYLEVRGRATLDEDRDRSFIDSIAKKYMGQDHYPFDRPGEERVTVTVHAEQVSAAAVHANVSDGQIPSDWT